MKNKLIPVILPTLDRFAPIGIDCNGTLHELNHLIPDAFHVYVTVPPSIDPIKTGDWCWDDYNKKLFISGSSNPGASRKIIATTDTAIGISCKCKSNCDLCTGEHVLPGVQQSFLEEFIANPEGEFVIEYSPEFCWTCKDTLVNSINCEGHEFVVKLNLDNTVNISLIEKKGGSESNLETKKLILDKVKLTKYPEQTTGGQSCGMMTSGVKLESDLGITIIVEKHRSHYKNRELAFLLMELAIDKLVI